VQPASEFWELLQTLGGEAQALYLPSAWFELR
jgi:hypothetical protein